MTPPRRPVNRSAGDARGPVEALSGIAEAMRDRDFDALAEALAADVVLVSPITPSFRFEGREDVLALLRIVREAFEDYEPGELLAGERPDTAALRFRTRVGGEALDGLDLVRFDSHGQASELTVFARPMPALAALAAALAPQLARQRGRWRAPVARAATRPLPALMKIADGLAARLLGRRRRQPRPKS